MRNRLLYVILLFSLTISAQQIQVLNANDRQPISGVAIFNDDKSKSGVTDFDGYVDITNFDASENITFQHIKSNGGTIDYGKEFILGNFQSVRHPLLNGVPVSQYCFKLFK